MKISGERNLPGAPEEVYQRLQDPAVLAACIPGCESLEKSGDNEYKMRMKMLLAAFSGQFEGSVRIADPQPPSSFRLLVEGSGKVGFMKGDGLLKLSANAEGTTLNYEGDVQVGGTIAGVGQRLIDTTARMMIGRFFDKFVSGGLWGRG